MADFIDEKDGLPSYSSAVETRGRRGRRPRYHRYIIRVLVAACVVYAINAHFSSPRSNQITSEIRTQKLQEDYATCSKLRNKPADPAGPRTRNARYIDGPSVLIKNATIWTGEPAEGATAQEIHEGTAFSWTKGDVLLEHGLITQVASSIGAADLPHDHVIYNAQGRSLTSGIVDMHSHLGVDPLPSLPGGEDTNELSDNVTPYVRSIDGLNPLDPQIQVIKSGGVTTSLVLPGSGNNFGGEAFVVKLAVGAPDGRPEISASDMLADPTHAWRYMKMACGENAKRVTGAKLRNAGGPLSRLGEAWYFRHAFEQASKLVRSQDEWCAAADKAGAVNMPDHLPQELEWESLGAVLRGQVLVNAHCYTVPDLESYVSHTNEFKFSVQAFHHAHQTYLVPEILKRAYGDRPPAAALFADNMNYKVEAYNASEQAGKILYDNGLTPVYVSDNPVINAQHVLFEAAKAFRYGLPYHAAFAGVTSASAELLGLGERIGKVKAGYDADVVVWDSDPLAVGAAPTQVWIDGTPQFKDPVELLKPAPEVLKQAVDTSSDMTRASAVHDLVVHGIKKVLIADDIKHEDNTNTTLVVRNGRIACLGTCTREARMAISGGARTLHLKDGHVTPGLTAFGSHLGLVEIQGERETKDGTNTAETFSAAVDGLALDGKNLKAAHAHGVTKAISAPAFRGISTGFRTGAIHALEKNAVWKDHVALHWSLTPEAEQGKTPTMSGAVGSLRTKLLAAVTSNDTKADSDTTKEDAWLYDVVHKDLPLVITVHSADVIASILRIKSAVEEAAGKPLRLILLGAAESHLLAAEIASAEVPVVLAPLLPYATSWDQRRSLTGAPLTNGTAIDILLAAGVKSHNLAIGVDEDWEARDLDLSAGTAFINAGGRLTEKEAIALVSTNIYHMLGLSIEYSTYDDIVVYEGSPLEITGRVKVVADGRGKLMAWV